MTAPVFVEPSAIAPLLKHAQSLLAAPGQWTQDAYARNEDDMACEFPSRTYCRSWCIIGALQHAAHAHVTVASSRPRILAECGLQLTVSLRRRHPSWLWLVPWQDDRKTTQDNVVGLIEYTRRRLGL